MRLRRKLGCIGTKVAIVVVKIIVIIIVTIGLGIGIGIGIGIALPTLTPKQGLRLEVED